MTSKNLPLVLIGLAALLLGGGLLVFDGGDDRVHQIAVLDPADAPDKLVVANPWGEGKRRETQLAEPERLPGGGDFETTVAWPLEIRLELLEASSDPKRDGIPARGTGANAKLSGLIRGRGQEGLSATITLLAGANEGRVFHTDKTGAFGANDLYPGLTLARVRSAQHVAVREIALRQGRRTDLNISFHRTTDLTGEVVDKRGNGVAGATVTIDGQQITTDQDGVFRFPRMTPGKLYAQVDKPGFASHRENLPLAGGKVVERGTVKFILEKGASLRVNVLERVGSRGDALLYFLPSVARGRDRRFPWHEFNPTRVVPGGSVLIEDMPAERVNLWLFHTGAKATPAASTVRLRAGLETSKTLHLEPATQIKGVVKLDGEPVRSARVVGESPDRVSATLSAFGEGPGFFDIALLPTFPVASQEVFTNDKGEFALTAWGAGLTGQYVSAYSADERLMARALLPKEKFEVELNLQPVDEGNSRVEIALPDRFQGLPIKVWVNGAPREPFVLPSDKELVIDGLRDGKWSFDSKWNSDRLEELPRFTLQGESRVVVPLPEGAVLGQTEDELRRAGKL